MIDYAAIDQGTGLRQLAMRSAPTVLHVLHHGDRVAELTLLWQLCSALQNHGYAVTVVDGTAEESEKNPGLFDLLEQPYGPAPLQDATRWTVIPSAQGLRALANQPRGLERLASLLADSAVLVIYGDAEALGALQDKRHQAQAGSRPVVALTPETSSLLSAYQGIKALASLVRPAEIVAVTVNPLDTPEYLADGIAKSLQNCTMNFLKCPVRHVSTQLKNQVSTVAEQAPEGIRQLALQLLGTYVPAAPLGQLAPSAGLTPIGTRASNLVSPTISARPKVAHDQRLWSH